MLCSYSILISAIRRLLLFLLSVGCNTTQTQIDYNYTICLLCLKDAVKIAWDILYVTMERLQNTKKHIVMVWRKFAYMNDSEI